MNQERTDLAALFKRLHGMGVESADLTCKPCKGIGERILIPCVLAVCCQECGGHGVAPFSQWNGITTLVLGELLNLKLEITEADVLAAAKRAGVY